MSTPQPVSVVSPELALVDPEFGRQQRALLPEPGSLLGGGHAIAPRPIDEHVAFRALAAAALRTQDSTAARPRTPTSWPPLAAVALLIVVGALLLDVRVDIGRTPASAESTRTPLAPVETEAVSPVLGMPPEPVRSPRPAVRSQARRFAWAPVRGADAYAFELFLGANLVFADSVERPQLSVPARWTFEGESRSLEPAEYRWYVWPVVDGTRAANAVVQAKLVIS